MDFGDDKDFRAQFKEFDDDNDNENDDGDDDKFDEEEAAFSDDGEWQYFIIVAIPRHISIWLIWNTCSFISCQGVVVEWSSSWF